MVVPDVVSLTSVADNFNAGCVALVDGVCTLTPALKVAGCLSSKLDVCQHVKIFHLIYLPLSDFQTILILVIRKCYS